MSPRKKSRHGSEKATRKVLVNRLRTAGVLRPGQSSEGIPMDRLRQMAGAK